MLDNERTVRRCINGIMQRLYLYREAVHTTTSMPYEDFDKIVAECAKENLRTITNLSQKDLCIRMLATMLDDPDRGE